MKGAILILLVAFTSARSPIRQQDVPQPEFPIAHKYDLPNCGVDGLAVAESFEEYLALVQNSNPPANLIPGLQSTLQLTSQLKNELKNAPLEKRCADPESEAGQALGGLISLRNSAKAKLDRGFPVDHAAEMEKAIPLLETLEQSAFPMAGKEVLGSIIQSLDSALNVQSDVGNSEGYQGRVPRSTSIEEEMKKLDKTLDSYITDCGVDGLMVAKSFQGLVEMLRDMASTTEYRATWEKLMELNEKIITELKEEDTEKHCHAQDSLEGSNLIALILLRMDTEQKLARAEPVEDAERLGKALPLLETLANQGMGGSAGVEVLKEMVEVIMEALEKNGELIVELMPPVDIPEPAIETATEKV